MAKTTVRAIAWKRVGPDDLDALASFLDDRLFAMGDAHPLAPVILGLRRHARARATGLRRAMDIPNPRARSAGAKPAGA